MAKFIVTTHVKVEYDHASIVDAPTEDEATRVGTKTATQEAKKLFASNGVDVKVGPTTTTQLGSRLTIVHKKGERGRPRKEVE